MRFLLVKLHTLLNLKTLNRKSLLLLIAFNVSFFFFFVKKINFTSLGANLVIFILIISLAFFQPLLFASSYATNLPLTPDGSTNTTIDAAANNVPIVDIATPNSGGLSHNKFIDYNVNSNGLLLNNASNNPDGILTTQIGGIITDNVNLKDSGSASIILNEVTSTNKSLLNGYTEIAGTQADLIIANPNGIEMNSAGFINVSRLTAIIGSANQFNPNPNDLTFNLAGNKNAGNNFLPKLTISGLGIDITRVAHTDLIANIMKIVSPIYGADNIVNLRAGDKEFNYDTKKVTSNNTTPGTNQPNEIAIDASNLSKIQAGQIYMVATVEGFGVKYTGDMLASRGGIKIDAKGNIIYGNVLAESGNIEVKTTNGDITANGVTQTKNANSDIKLEASNNITNQGQLLSARSINVTAGHIFSNEGSNINLSNNDFTVNANNVNNLGILSSNHNFTINNASILANEGSISALNNLTIAADQITSLEMIANNDLTITSRELTSTNIIAQNKLNITATDFLTNNNDILSLTTNLLDENGDLENSLIINAGTITNNNRISANGNLRINADELNNIGATSLIKANDIFIISATSLNNEGSISALNNLTINSNIITSEVITAGRDISLSASQITNSDSIIAGNKVNITATDFLTNNNDILSLVQNLLYENGDLATALTINAKILNNNKRIATNSGLTINSNSLNNNTANSLILSGKDVNLNITNLNNNLGTLESKNNLNIRNLRQNNPDAALLLSVSNTNTAISNSEGFIKAKTAIDINIGSSNYEITGKLEAEGYIDITAGNITNKADIGAKNYIKLVASGYFTNGIDGGDNSNIKIASGTYLDITANNNINNYATLSAKTNLTLKSNNGNINNYNGAELIASDEDAPATSSLTLEAINGAINQYSPNSVVVNGDHTITSYDYTNTGRIDIAGTLIMNIAHDLINEIDALIYAGNNMFLNVVNNITNKTGGVIYSENDLTIRKYDSSNANYDVTDPNNNKVNKLDNISGNIETYAGDIYISATTLINTRAQFASQDPTIVVYHRKSDGRYWHSMHEYTYSGINAASSLISSGNNLTLNLGDLTNNGSKITSQQNMVLNVDNDIINNSFYIFSGTRESYLGKTRHYGSGGGWRYWGGSKWKHHSEKYIYNEQLYASSIIKSGSSMVITQDGSLNSELINAQGFEDYSPSDNIDQRIPTSVNAINITTLLDSGKVEFGLDDGVTDGDLADDSPVRFGLDQYFDGPDNQGMFTKNANPNSPLFETRSQFIDQSKFFGSDYFYQKIGLDLTDVQTQLDRSNTRLVGDQFFQTKLIEDQLKSITNDSFLLSKSETNTNEEIKDLIDNAALEYSRLGLNVNETITQSQIDNLEKDIIWFETETINGSLYVVPKIYLSKATRERLNNNNSLTTKSTIMAMGDLQLNSDSLTNSGSISANNIAITTINDITNDNFSSITSNNNLDLTSDNGSIINFSKLKGGGVVSLTAANSITNTALVKTNDANLLNSDNIAYISNGASASNSGNISSTLIESALIEAGSLNINAGNDFNNYGSNITSAGNITITAGDDVNIGTVKLRNRSEIRSKKYTSITDTTKNIGSNISAGGNFTLSASNNALIKGSDLLVGGSANITTGNELSIVSATDSYYKLEETKKKRSFGRGKRYSSTIENKTQLSSNIIAGGDIIFDSVSDINIIASNLIGNNGLMISQAGDVNIKNGINSVKSFTTSKKKGSLSKRSDKVYDYQETAAKSSLNFANDLLVTAQLGDVNLQGSTIDTGNNLNFGDFTIAQNIDGSFKTNADGTFKTTSVDSVQNVNITTAKLKNEHWEEHKSTSFNPINAAISAIGEVASLGGLNPIADKLNKKLEKLTDKLGENLNSGDEAVLTKTENKSGYIKENQYASTVNVGGNLNINASENVKIEGSNINVTGDGNINAAKVDIISIAQISSSYEKDKKIEIGEVNVRFENGSFKAGVKGSGEEHKYKQENSVQQASNVNIGNNLLINSTNDIDIVASNIVVNNSAIIKTGGDFNLSDASDTQKTNTENSKLEVEIGVKVGNAYVDVGYAAKALADATKNLKDSTKKLDKMQKLKSEGRASQKAVDLAVIQIALATVGVATATASLAASGAQAAAAASSSLGTGMYAAAYMDTMYQTDFSKTNSSQSASSSLIVGNNIDIDANKNYNQTGSLLASNNGDVSIGAVEANIKAGENTFQSEFGSKTTNASVSVGNNGVGISAGYSQSDNFILSNSYTNSEILAQNGTFNLNTTGDTNIKGGNVTANQVAMNIGGDLNLETLQDTHEQQGSSYGINIGAGVGKGGDGATNGGVSSVGISMGATDIFSKTTGRATGIVALSSNDNNLTEAQNLNNLLNSNSITVAGNIDNQTQKEDLTFINADFEASLTVPTAIFTKAGRAKMKDDIMNLDKNLMTATAGAILNVTDSITVAVNKTTGNSKDGAVKDWKQERTKSTKGLKSYIENYDNRDNLSQEGYRYYESLTKQQIKDDLIILPDNKAIYHTFQFDEQGKPINITSGVQENYIKYIHPTKGYEIVVNNSNPDNPIVVTDTVNKGTYNHFNPGGLTGNVGHTLLDVVPYFIHGNDEKILPNSSTPTDNTWATDRIGRTFYKPK